MAQPYPPQQHPQPESPTTDNPVVALGRKVKSVLGTSQQPSVRIRCGKPISYSTGHESGAQLAAPPNDQFSESQVASQNTTGAGSTSNHSRFSRWLPFGRREQADDDSSGYEYDADTVDLLDIVDPEVATLSTLTNVQNSLFVPQLGGIVNRRATYRVSETPEEASIIKRLQAKLKRIANLADGDEKAAAQPAKPTIKLQYAVLPDGETLPGWTKADVEELDDRVRHELHSRRAKFGRKMKGFWQYVRRPLGLFVTVYATLITLFGAAWVLFLIGWISLGSKRDYVVNVVDNVLVALFAIIGDGLAPFRAVDTYHMVYIAYYHRKTWRTRAKLGLPRLVDHNDLPDLHKEDIEPENVDLESLVARRMPRGLAKRVAPRIPKKLAQRMVTRRKTNDNPAYEYSVLTKAQQAKLEFHERKFSKSHTFYKPHETETHYAFPLKLLVAIVLLLDCHSALQITLGACTWGIPYQTRPFALTTVVLCCSITCNIMGGVLIAVGDRRTRKTDVIERMERQELTAEAIQEMRTQRMKEAEERGEIDPRVRQQAQQQRDDAENEEIKKSWKNVPMLPKTLLGKGVDHRQPSLPQKARTSGTSLRKNGTRQTQAGASLPPVIESAGQPSQPEPVLARGTEVPKETKAQKALRMIRRADFDRS